MNSSTFEVDFSGSTYLETSITSPYVNRLNWRCDRLLTQNRGLLQGKRVLDLASHDGRFTYAALRLGAASVVGVEARQHLIDKANMNLGQEFLSEEHFSFIQADIFDFLKNVAPGMFDVVFCFGFLYHTYRQVEFFQELQRLAPEVLLIDSTVTKIDLAEDSVSKRFGALLRRIARTDKKAILKKLFAIRKSADVLVDHFQPQDARETISGFLKFRVEDSSWEGATIEKQGVVAVPTRRAIEILSNLHGFESEEIDFLETVTDWTALNDYRIGTRVAYVCKAKQKPFVELA